MSEKLCPMSFTNPRDGLKCRTDECAWWDDDWESCAIHMMVLHMDKLVNYPDPAPRK